MTHGWSSLGSHGWFQEPLILIIACEEGHLQILLGGYWVKVPDPKEFQSSQALCPVSFIGVSFGSVDEGYS